MKLEDDSLPLQPGAQRLPRYSIQPPVTLITWPVM